MSSDLPDLPDLPQDLADEDDYPKRLLFARTRMSMRQRDYLTLHLPRFKITLNKKRRYNPQQWFDTPHEDYALEIGFGSGEHLLRQAAMHPTRGFIGCEPFPAGVVKLLRGIDEQGLTNIRIYYGDGNDILQVLHPQTLCDIYLLYPDPWHKRKHHKRRFINEDNLECMHHLLTPKGGFLFASDIAPYVDWTLIHMRRSNLFRLVARDARPPLENRAENWLLPPPHWYPTRYEEKAQTEGRGTTYLRFQKIS